MKKKINIKVFIPCMIVVLAIVGSNIWIGQYNTPILGLISAALWAYGGTKLALIISEKEEIDIYKE